MTATQTLRINRAPVLTLWAVVVAERLGMPRETALTVGQALAGITACSKGVRLGIYAPPGERPLESGDVDVAKGLLAGYCAMLSETSGRC